MYRRSGVAKETILEGHHCDCRGAGLAAAESARSGASRGKWPAVGIRLELKRAVEGFDVPRRHLALLAFELLIPLGSIFKA
jgi:hypothetical protein